MTDKHPLQASNDSQNNFTALRILFATFIIITHAYSLSGLKESDLLFKCTGGQFTYSYLGLAGFFSISGFLVTKSLFTTKNLIRYYWKRCIRIFPALVVCLTATVLVGSLIGERDSISYFSDYTTWTYIPYNLVLFKRQAGIGNILIDNPIRTTINGSLWTLSMEFTLYILISFLFFSKNTVLSKYLSFLALCSFLVVDIYFRNETIHIHAFNMNFYWLFHLGTYFMGGAFLANIAFQKTWGRRPIILFLLFTLLLAIYLNQYENFKFLLPPIVIYIGLQSTPILSSISKAIGDISYGVYLYAFPIQQIIFLYFAPDLRTLQIGSIIIAYLFGWLSWYIIERPCLSLKNITFKC